MKKLTGVIALLLIVLLCAVYRRLTAGSSESNGHPSPAKVTSVIREGLLLTNLMMQ